MTAEDIGASVTGGDFLTNVATSLKENPSFPPSAVSKPPVSAAEPATKTVTVERVVAVTPAPTPDPDGGIDTSGDGGIFSSSDTGPGAIAADFVLKTSSAAGTSGVAALVITALHLAVVG